MTVRQHRRGVAIPDALRAEVLRRYRDGEGMKVIAWACGVSIGSVTNIARRAGAYRHQAHLMPTAEPEEAEF